MNPKGLRLNNPGCIRRSFTHWQGASALQGDKDFVTFIGPEWGLRAIVRILDSYQREGLDTVRRVITRWSPPHENPTEQYVLNVAQACAVDPDTPILLSAHREDLVRAIVHQECGSWPYTDQILQLGIELASKE